MAPIVARVVNLFQKGFLPGKLIGENGLLVHLIAQQAQYQPSTGIGLLLDQKKACDKVLDIYLIQVLHAFCFPVVVIECIEFDT
ncbi:hypothetical protein A0J61_07783 [Choanephora cucurbitarum]|uniref:Reverse transcriptase domain-containing protein n=1 Tax=Choanephora cucurbitarum TaxID=101091 RepID=A0A1C7N508_9FUNG|nr:hypothetical protein A0J61_07783 [Choanephora cucurbitarum]